MIDLASVHVDIASLDDAAAVEVLARVVRGRGLSTELGVSAPVLRRAVAACVAEEGLTPPASASEGEVARAALRALAAAAPERAEDIGALARADHRAHTFSGLETIAVLGLVIAVLQTEVTIEVEDGRITAFSLRKRASGAKEVTAFLETVAGFFGRPSR
ncbi:MAG: hypothetical protein AAGI30_12575 [Planctomycetota bacterium]